MKTNKTCNLNPCEICDAIANEYVCFVKKVTTERTEDQCWKPDQPNNSQNIVYKQPQTEMHGNENVNVNFNRCNAILYIRLVLNVTFTAVTDWRQRRRHIWNANACRETTICSFTRPFINIIILLDLISCWRTIRSISIHTWTHNHDLLQLKRRTAGERKKE